MPATTLLLLGGVTVGTVGCGGGGGGGSQRATLDSTRTAIIEVVQQSRRLPSLVSSLSTGTATRAAARRADGLIAVVASRLWSGAANRPTRQADDLEYLPEFDLYARVTEGATSLRYDFFEDASGTQGAGNFTASVTGVNTGRINFNVTGGTTPIIGTVNLTRIDETSLRTAGTLRLPATDETITLDLTSDSDTDSAAGSVAITNDNGTLRYRNLEAYASGGLDADLEYRGATGGVSQNADGSGQATLALAPQRGYEAIYNSDGGGVLTRFDGADELQLSEAVEDFDELD